MVRVILASSIAALVFLGFASPASARTRTYFIAAELVDWNYAPTMTDVLTGMALQSPAPDHIWTTYRKAIYREYTDATFLHLKPKAAADAYLGFVGPPIRAEVGDTIRVVFKNKTDRPYSIHPHGVLYLKNSEGAPYSDGTPAGEKKDDAVAPGRGFTYIWQVPLRAGPGPADGSSVLWMYHSHVNEQRDVASGLIGPLIIYSKGVLQRNGLPKGIDREFILLFAFLNENQSWYLDYNALHYTALGAKRTKPTSLAAFLENRDFKDSNLLPSINGFIEGNMPMVTMRRGEHVRWYVLADATDDADYHVIHWHGQTLLMSGSRTDTIEVLPAGMRVADMVPDNPGVWLVHCHVPGHSASMAARFRVLP